MTQKIWFIQKDSMDDDYCNIYEPYNKSGFLKIASVHLDTFWNNGTNDEVWERVRSGEIVEVEVSFRVINEDIAE